MKKFLTVAGNDSCGGAGAGADMRVATRHGLFSASVITALTAQTKSRVRGVLLTPPEFVERQLDAAFGDGAPDAVKIGMLGNAEIADTVARKLLEYGAKNIVLDTVFASSSGYELLSKEGIAVLKEKLLPICRCFTPNIPEAEILSDMKINGKQDMEKCAAKLFKISASDVIITGGHSENECDDLLFANGEITWFSGEKIKGASVHGTGCAFSSCLACNLALGRSLKESVKISKDYVLRKIKCEIGGL